MGEGRELKGGRRGRRKGGGRGKEKREQKERGRGGRTGKGKGEGKGPLPRPASGGRRPRARPAVGCRAHLALAGLSRAAPHEALVDGPQVLLPVVHFEAAQVRAARRRYRQLGVHGLALGLWPGYHGGQGPAARGGRRRGGRGRRQRGVGAARRRARPAKARAPRTKRGGQTKMGLRDRRGEAAGQAPPPSCGCCWPPALRSPGSRRASRGGAPRPRTEITSPPAGTALRSLRPAPGPSPLSRTRRLWVDRSPRKRGGARGS